MEKTKTALITNLNLSCKFGSSVEISITWPVDFANVIQNYAINSRRSISQETELMIRNGESIQLLLNEAIQNEDQEGIAIYGNAVLTGISKITMQEHQAKPTGKIFNASPDLEERYDQFQSNFDSMKSETRKLVLTDDLGKFLTNTAHARNRSINLIMLVLIQRSLAAKMLIGNWEPTELPELDPAKIEFCQKLMQCSSIIFLRDADRFTPELVKKTEC